MRNLLRVGHVFTGAFTVRFTGGLRARISFTGFNRKLYGHGIWSFLLCVCAECCLSPYCQLFRGFELVRCRIFCPDDRALR